MTRPGDRLVGAYGELLPVAGAAALLGLVFKLALVVAALVAVAWLLGTLGQIINEGPDTAKAERAAARDPLRCAQADAEWRAMCADLDAKRAARNM